MKRSMRNLRYVAITLVLIAAFVASVAPATVSAAPAAGAAEAPAYSGRYHVVRHGETLSHIARYYGVTIDAIKRANHLYGNTIYVGQHLYIPYPQSSHTTGCSRVHYVRYGETLSHIARYYGTTTAALTAANGIYDPSHIYVGQKICIPNIYSSGYGYNHKSDYGKKSYYGKPYSGYYGKSYGSCVYVVQRGDTLSEIAKWNGLSTRQLAYMNGIHNWSYIYVGQRLRVC
jgi:LysM repeat protein